MICTQVQCTQAQAQEFDRHADRKFASSGLSANWTHLTAHGKIWQVGLFVSVHRIRVRRMCDAQLSWLSKYVTIFHNCSKRGRTSSYHNKGKHAASSRRALQSVPGCLHCDCFCWSQLTQTRPKTCSSHVQALQATGDMLKDRKTSVKGAKEGKPEHHREWETK